MARNPAALGHGEIDVLILKALVRKLVVKNVLSTDDVSALLLDAAKNLRVASGRITSQAAQIIVNEDLIPAFLQTDEPQHQDES